MAAIPLPSGDLDGVPASLPFEPTIPIRVRPSVTAEATFVIPAVGVWKFEAELWPVDHECPHPSSYEPYSKQRLVWRLRHVSTGEVCYATVPAVVTLHGT